MRFTQVGLAVAIVAVTVLFATAALPGSARAFSNPTITSVAPSSGSSAGGTRITITGTDFLPSATVFIGGAQATSVTVQGTTQITATTPRGTNGPANVLVNNGDGGAITLNSGFFYVDPTAALNLTSLSPSTGSVRGGTQVTITGGGMAAGATVLFGGAPATNVLVAGPSLLTLRTPPAVPGAVTVTVLNPDGTTAALANGFTYDAGGMEVTSVTPQGGIAAGGTAVRISGNAFANGATVLFGAAAATNVTVVNSALITATAPAGASGNVAVTVANPGGTSASLAGGFTYRSTTTAAGLTISSLSPNTGPALGGTLVSINGTGFSGGAAVYFGNLPATDVNRLADSSLTVRAPLSVAGAVPVTVVNSDGASVTLANAYTYTGNNDFAIASLVPNSGPAAGGTVIVITGNGFATGAMVTVGGKNATNVWVIGSSQVYATVPAGTTGPATVTVTNPGGIAASLTSGFTYGAATPLPTPTATPAPPSASSGLPLPQKGFGLFVFGGGTNAQLVAASGCTASTLAFWVTNAAGEFDTYVPGTSIVVVNAAWNARFGAAIPPGTAVIGSCTR